MQLVLPFLCAYVHMYHSCVSAERPKTVRKDSTVPTTSKMNVTPSLEALNATNMTDTDITSASDTPVWLIVTATIVALILRAGMSYLWFTPSNL